MLRSDERFFFGSFQPLQVPLAAERLVPVFIGFIIYELYREARAGVLGAPLFVVRGQPLVKVCCPAAVQRAVRAAEQINNIHIRSIRCFFGFILKNNAFSSSGTMFSRSKHSEMSVGFTLVVKRMFICRSLSLLIIP